MRAARNATGIRESISKGKRDSIKHISKFIRIVDYRELVTKDLSYNCTIYVDIRPTICDSTPMMTEPKWMTNAYGAAIAIQQICCEVRTEQSAFLSAIGMTWEQAKVLPEQGKRAIQFAWESYNVR